MIKCLKDEVIEVVIYEPVLKEEEFESLRVIRIIDGFKQESDIIIVNHLSK